MNDRSTVGKIYRGADGGNEMRTGLSRRSGGRSAGLGAGRPSGQPSVSDRARQIIYLAALALVALALGGAIAYGR